MAHFAKLGINGKVIGVHAVNNSDLFNADGVEDEKVGQQFLERIHGWPTALWIQTSYNTQNGVHKLGGTALRGNYAGVGKIYDEDNDLFIAKQPYASWTLNTTTASWEAPTPRPEDLTAEEKAAGTHYVWNEDTKAWDKTTP